MINGISLFANVGIAETYIKKYGINIAVANELLPKRAKFYSHLYPECNMICGDIRDRETYNTLVKEYKENNCDFIIATPPCQGFSVAGKMDTNDIRNNLILNIIEFMIETKPSNVLIENVQGFLKADLVNKAVKFLREEMGYIVNSAILDAQDYGTPQRRKRAILLISKGRKWELPEKQKHITVREAIGDLPSLESGDVHSKYHYAKKHNDNHILWMKHTPTGKSAFDNPIYYPKKNGRKIKGFSSTYRRIDWNKPAPTITMSNGAISSQNNVHPGKKMKNGTYSDARVLSILELLRLTGLPDNWNIPEWASENLIRQVIGESFPPKFCAALIKKLVDTP